MERQDYLDTIKQHLRTAYLLSEERSEAMIPVFLATLHGHMNRLAELAAEGDMEPLGRTAHAVKGALLNMGLPDLAELARRIELQCRQRTGPVDRTLITDLERAVRLLAGS